VGGLPSLLPVIGELFEEVGLDSGGLPQAESQLIIPIEALWRLS
jgi:hypothetical protein